jgi:hypothetical protein
MSGFWVLFGFSAKAVQASPGGGASSSGEPASMRQLVGPFGRLGEGIWQVVLPCSQSF